MEIRVKKKSIKLVLVAAENIYDANLEPKF